MTFTDNVQKVFDASVTPERFTNEDPATTLAVPPQVLVRLLGVETTIPAGRLSVKARPVNGMVLAPGLVIVNVNEVEPFNGMPAAPNALVITGGVATARFAVAALPIPPSRENTGDVMLVQFPDIVPCTITTIVQLLFTGTTPLICVMGLPGGPTTDSPGVQVLDTSPIATSPGGRRSVNATWFRATVLAAGLVIVKVSEVVPFNGIPGAPKALVITGGATTLMLAEAVPPGTLSFEVTMLVVLFFVPAVVPVTFTTKLHDVLAARLLTVMLIKLNPSGAVIVPTQFANTTAGEPITNPAGKVSLKAMPLSDVIRSGFETVNVNVVVAFKGIPGAPKVFVSIGASGTGAICTVTVKALES